MDPVMTLTEESSQAVVALLLDDIAPPRLGTLLRAARKEHGLTRRDVAGRVGTTPGELRRYERGDAPVPPSIVAELAECYGDDLAAQFATRLPIQVDERRVVVAGKSATADSENTDDVLRTYVAIVARLRESQPGAPIALRADDVVALSSALGQDANQVETRIVEILGCTAHEAHSLHLEMLRRKLVVPVAGFVAGLAVVSGVGLGVASAETNTGRPPAAHAAHAPTAYATTPPATVAPKPVAPAVEAPAPAEAAPAPEPVVAEAPAPVVEPAAQSMPRPVIAPDDTPMSIPPNETVTIIQP
jgi:transcriptional regulator with XRE-family HTH domain